MRRGPLTPAIRMQDMSLISIFSWTFFALNMTMRLPCDTRENDLVSLVCIVLVSSNKIWCCFLWAAWLGNFNAGFSWKRHGFELYLFLVEVVVVVGGCPVGSKLKKQVCTFHYKQPLVPQLLSNHGPPADTGKLCCNWQFVLLTCLHITLSYCTYISRSSYLLWFVKFSHNRFLMT